VKTVAQAELELHEAARRRRVKAHQLREEGLTFAQIAARLGVSRQRATIIVKSARSKASVTS